VKRPTLSTFAMLAAAAIWIFPYFWMLTTSLKTLPEIVSNPSAIFPKSVQFNAYQIVAETLPVARYLWNTTLMAVLIAAVQIALGIVATLLIPAQVRFVPIFTLLAELRLVNTMAGLVLPFGVSALGTFLLRQALLAIPDELIEAARLDGASELRIIYRLLPPLVLPSLTAFFLFSFVYHWNDYFWPLVMTTDDSVRTLPLGVALLREQGTGVRWHIVMAGNVLLSAPALAVFALTQRHLLRAVASKPI
jgi:sn-glycerol 3-phosphate transport system permease protein